MTFDELLSKYFVFKILRPATITSYTGVVRRVHTQFGVRDINDYTTEDWLKYRTEVLANRSALTWNSIRRHMNAVYNFGIEEGYLLLGNPLKRVKFAPEPQVPPKCVSNADLLCNVEKYAHEGQLYREKNGRSRSMRNVWFWGIYCRVCFYTGMRLGQAVNLIWDDINFYKGEILLRSEHSKTHLEWIVPIPQDVVEELRELLNQVKAAAPQHSTGHSNVFLVSVFQRQNATSIIQTMTQSHTKKFFIGYSILVGQKVGPHRMRHTCATVMVKSVPNMKVAQLMLGHCSIKTTMKYVHPDISEMRRAQETLVQVSRIA